MSFNENKITKKEKETKDKIEGHYTCTAKLTNKISHPKTEQIKTFTYDCFTLENLLT